MESFKQFLETASINGLNHISSTRGCTRLFWITLLAMGFVVSSVLIWESFVTWADNPVRTTTRTLPMKEIRFPKLTVCPPKNTFTDLNYDLMLTENVTLTKETKNELYEYAVAMIDEHVYMDPWDKIHEENRFLNWYTGFTSMYYEPFLNPLKFFEYKISTSATSGVFKTQYFGESYNPSLVDDKQDYVINVFPPRSIRYNKSVTLHFKVEKLSMPVLGGFDDIAVSDESYDNSYIAKKLNIFEKSFTPPANHEGIQFIDSRREASDREIAEANLKLMPGFRLSWYYTGVDFNPDPLLDFPIWANNYKFSKNNYYFIREALNQKQYITTFCFRFLNMLDEANLDHSLLWRHVRAVRSEYRKKKKLHKNCRKKALISDDEERETLFDNLQDRLRVSNQTDEIKSLPNRTIEEGGKMFVYLISCPALHWQNFYYHLLFEKTNSEMILSVLNAMKNSRTMGSRAVANKVLVRLADVLGFKYKYFANETKWVNNFDTVKG